MTATPVLLFDMDRSLIQRTTSSFKTFCKLGRHGILVGKPTVWLNAPYPLGLSCLTCAKQKAPGAVAAELARQKGEVKPDLGGLTHGKVGTYNKGCRCEPCRKANTARSVAYKRARRERQAAS